MTRPVEPAGHSGHEHAVRFYESDRSLAMIVAEFLQNGFAEGHAAIIVATSAQRAAILRELNNRCVDVVDLQRSGGLVFLDAKDTLSTFMVDGMPDESKFMTRMCELIDGACDGQDGRTVRIYGQMVDVLWQGGEHDAAIRLEMLWNQLAQTKRYSLLCGYAMGHFYKDAKFDAVIRQHTRVDADGRSAEIPGMPLSLPAASDA
jgi:DcmR-like sensory protein